MIPPVLRIMASMSLVFHGCDLCQLQRQHCMALHGIWDWHSLSVIPVHGTRGWHEL